MMDSVGILKRKIQLKNQALRLIRREREELQHKLALLEIKAYLERQLGGDQDFNPYLSQRLETLQALIDSLDISSSQP